MLIFYASFVQKSKMDLLTSNDLFRIVLLIIWLGLERGKLRETVLEREGKGRKFQSKTIYLNETI